MGENGVLGGGGMTPADVAAVMGNNDGSWGGNGAWWIIVLFALMMGGNGWNWGNRGYQPQYATQDFVQQGLNFNDLQDQNRDLMQAITSGTAQAVNATNQTFHDTISVLSDKYSELQRDVAGLAVGQANALANQNQCCCETKMLISEQGSQARYDSAMQNNAVLQAIQAEGNATRAMLQQNKIEALQQKVQGLELQNAVAGVVRYPMSTAYNAGFNPFCNCGNNGCGCM